MAALTVVIAMTTFPGVATAGGCEVLHDTGDRVSCEARAEARSSARAEVERAVADEGPAARASGPQSAAWQDAIDESRGVHLDALLAPRPLAAVIGLAWFGLLVRSRWRARTRSRA